MRTLAVGTKCKLREGVHVWLQCQVDVLWEITETCGPESMPFTFLKVLSQHAAAPHVRRKCNDESHARPFAPQAGPHKERCASTVSSDGGRSVSLEAGCTAHAAREQTLRRAACVELCKFSLFDNLRNNWSNNYPGEGGGGGEILKTTQTDALRRAGLRRDAPEIPPKWSKYYPWSFVRVMFKYRPQKPTKMALFGQIWRTIQKLTKSGHKLTNL